MDPLYFENDPRLYPQIDIIAYFVSCKQGGGIYPPQFACCGSRPKPRRENAFAPSL